MNFEDAIAENIGEHSSASDESVDDDSDTGPPSVRKRERDEGALLSAVSFKKRKDIIGGGERQEGVASGSSGSGSYSSGSGSEDAGPGAGVRWKENLAEKARISFQKRNALNLMDIVYKYERAQGSSDSSFSDSDDDDDGNVFRAKKGRVRERDTMDTSRPQVNLDALKEKFSSGGQVSRVSAKTLANACRDLMLLFSRVPVRSWIPNWRRSSATMMSWMRATTTITCATVLATTRKRRMLRWPPRMRWMWRAWMTMRMP